MEGGGREGGRKGGQLVAPCLLYNTLLYSRIQLLVVFLLLLLLLLVGKDPVLPLATAGPAPSTRRPLLLLSLWLLWRRLMLSWLILFTRLLPLLMLLLLWRLFTCLFFLFLRFPELG